MSDVLVKEVCRTNPECEIRIKQAAWDENDLAVKFTWFDRNGNPARGGEFPLDALPQMLEVAVKHGYLKLAQA